LALESSATITLKVERQDDADLLGAALAAYVQEIERRDDGYWVVHIVLDEQTNPRVIELFEVLSRWLKECNLESFPILFGRSAYTVFRAEDGANPDTA
jgi:hypothetical protein